MHNPDPQSAIETTPILEEVLCLIGPASKHRRSKKVLPGMPISDLPQFRLIVPEQSHVTRRLLDTQAAISGVKLQIGWEVSSVAAILDLVRAGYGYAVMSEHAAAYWGHANELEARPLIEPRLHSTLCVCTAAHRKSSALAKRCIRLLPELILTSVPRRLR